MQGEMLYEKKMVLEKLKIQLVGHKAILEEAWVGFKKDAVERLAKVLDQLEKGDRAGVSVYVEAPEDHTREIELAIAMLEATTQDHVALGSRDFANYVLGNWEWNERFLLSNAKYSARATGALATSGKLPG